MVTLDGGPMAGQTLAPPAGAQIEYLELRLAADGMVHRYGPSPLRAGILSWMGRVGQPEAARES